MRHTYEFDEAMLGSEWTEQDDMHAFAEHLQAAFAARDIECDVTVCATSNNGGAGLICHDADPGCDCDHISGSAIDHAWQDALEAYALQPRVAVTLIDGGPDCEFRLGEHVAYGTYESLDVYSVDVAPTQADFDAIVAVLDGLDG